MMRKFYKRLLRVAVLTEDEPIPELDLTDLSYVVTHGDASAEIVYEDPIALTPKEMAQEALAQGTDPEFFGLDDDGNDISIDELFGFGLDKE